MRKCINGQDLTASSHEEAVKAFHAAQEPIVVEVLRRAAKSGSSTTGASSGGDSMKTRAPPTMVSIATQTDQVIEDAYLNLFQPPAPPFGMCGFENLGLVQPSSRQGVAFSPLANMGLSDLELANGLEFDEDYDGERAYDMEYEEVTLHRRSSKEKIGLTLCYSNTEDGITDIFISEVEPYSIAAQDGGIRERDQILQINNVDVHSREQAIQLFSENRSDITLLLARPQVVPMDDGFMDERGNTLDDLYSLEVLEQTGRQDLDFTAAVFAHGNEEEGGTTDTATTENSNKHDKDSGVGRTDESTKNDESSEQELIENDCASRASNSKYVGGGLGGSSAELHYSNDSFTSTDMANDHEIPPEVCDKFRQVLETRCPNGANGNAQDCSPKKLVVTRNNNVILPPRKDSQSSIEREIAALNHEMEQIQIECQEIVEAHAREQQKIHKQSSGSEGDGAKGGAGSSPAAGSGSPGEAFRSPRMVPRMGTRLDYLKQLHAAQESLSQGGSPVWGPRHEQFTNNHPAVFQALGADPSSSGVSTMDSNVRKSKDGSNRPDKDASTSAYNTGESCRSTPLTLELHQASDDSGTSGKGHKTSMLCLAAPTTSAAVSSSSTVTKPSHSDSERLLAGSSHPNSCGKEWSSDGDGRLTKSQSNSSVSRMSQTQDPASMNSLQELYTQYADVMYTNKANLQHTIMVQQKLFQQQLMQRACKLNNNGGLPEPPPRTTSCNGATGSSSNSGSTPTGAGSKSPLHSDNGGVSHGATNGASPSHSASSPDNPQNHIYQEIPSPTKPDNGGATSSCNASGGAQMEWVVKRRADGSRYITRRPVRSKLLKERAKKVAEERCGMTTDDDAVSELKVGKYWSKEERKRHVEKAKDHRRKKETILKSKMETVKEGEETGAAGQASPHRKEPNIVELSHRKMMKHKGKKVFDDFTTLQEMLAHGSREPQGKTYNPLLSVTTV